MNYAEDCVAFYLRVDYYANCIKVVDLIEGLILILHFFVNRIDRFDASFKCEFYSVFF